MTHGNSSVVQLYTVYCIATIDHLQTTETSIPADQTNSPTNQTNSPTNQTNSPTNQTSSHHDGQDMSTFIFVH